ncbi:MAG: type II toxin-antitoxin system VapC family toxin [Vulcanimicrobiota bacterium]
MIIDASALVAILLGEPEAAIFIQAIATAGKRLVAAVSVLETAIVVETKKGPAGGRELDLFLHAAQIDVAAMTYEQTELARWAYRQFGEGRHPARLNLGDCCSYALSKHSGEPLLYKGKDFTLTDVDSAL